MITKIFDTNWVDRKSFRDICHEYLFFYDLIRLTARFNDMAIVTSPLTIYLSIDISHSLKVFTTCFCLNKKISS